MSSHRSRPELTDASGSSDDEFQAPHLFLESLEFPPTSIRDRPTADQGHLLPACVWVQSMEVCYLPVHVSAPEVLGHTRHICMRACVCSWFSHSLFSCLQASLPESSVPPYASHLSIRTRREDLHMELSRAWLHTFCGKQCLAVWTEVTPGFSSTQRSLCLLEAPGRRESPLSRCGSRCQCAASCLFWSLLSPKPWSPECPSGASAVTGGVHQASLDWSERPIGLLPLVCPELDPERSREWG